MRTANWKRWGLAGFLAVVGGLASAPDLRAQPGDSAAKANIGPDGWPTKTAADEAANTDTQKVYVVRLRGELGRDISATPMRQIMAEIKKMQPDILVFQVDLEFRMFGEERDETDRDAMGIEGLEKAREITSMFTDDIRQDASWTKKPRLVMWVRRALGMSAFIPFVAPDIFYTSDGLHGGLGGIEQLLQSMASERVKEKQWSLRMGRALGLAQLGGHDDRILRAMMELRFKLSMDTRGGKPVFHEDYTGETLLKEDPIEDKNRADTTEQVARMQGNDLLTLNAEKAIQVGLIKAKADQLSEIMDELGFGRNYVATEGRSAKIIEGWSESVGKAEQEFLDQWRKFNEIQVTGQTPAERNQKRGAQLGILRKISQLLTTYREAINPRRIRGAPEGWANQIDIMMEQIRQQMRVDR